MAEQEEPVAAELQADLVAEVAGVATAAAAVAAVGIQVAAVETPGATTVELEDTEAGAVATMQEQTPLCRLAET
jgi:hypothetical protein